MKNFLISGMAVAGFLLAVPDTAYAHGGQYRGPGDTTPGGPGRGGGRTPGPSGPSTPGPSGPSTPGPSGPSSPGPSGPATGGPAGPGASGPTTGAGGVQLGDDLTRWQFWWEFNKDPYINLKEAVHGTGEVTHSDEFFMGAGRVHDTAKDTMKPTENQILNEVLPALKRALDSTDQRDITSSCMVAMAKIGKNGENFQILPIFKERLKSPDQEIRETAALAMGVSQMTEATEDLIGLLLDNSAGRALVGRSQVDDRVRSFASYGLGLIGHATANVVVKRQIFEALKQVLEIKDLPGRRNIRTACINSIGLLRPDASDGEGKKLLEDALTALEKHYAEKLGVGEQMIQAHVPPAVAKLLQGVDNDALDARKQAFKKLFLDELNGKSKVKKTSNTIVQSAAIALGRLARPYEDKRTTEALDRDISESLLEYYQKGKDHQATYFSLIALAQIGGLENRNALLKALEKGNKGLQKPWAALALGVLAFNQNADKSGAVDLTIGRALHKWIGKVRNPEAQSALAIAMGLASYQDAADDLRDMLVQNQSKDELAGYLSVGLALMNDQRSVETISGIARTSVRRPGRLQQCAIALGKLGDKNVAEMLTAMLTEDESVNLAKMSAIASALGFIGDRRTLDPLIQMLFNESLTDLSRAFAAVALGGVADKEPLPWNSKIATNMNYRASVETLTNQVNGILDIL